MIGTIKLFSDTLLKKRVSYSFSWYARMIFFPGNLRVCYLGMDRRLSENALFPHLFVNLEKIIIGILAICLR